MRSMTGQNSVAVFRAKSRSFTVFSVALSCVLLGCGAESPAPFRSPSSATIANTTKPSAQRLLHTQAESIFSGEPLRHVFGRVNDSQETLHLDPGGIAKSCGCTSVVIDKYDWSPGQSASFEMAVQTSGKS